MNYNIEDKILKGWSYITNQELEKAEELCDELKLLYDEQGEREKINIKKYMVRVNIAKREWEKGKENVTDIMNLDSDIAEMHKLNAMIEYHLNNYEIAEEEFRKALKLAKNKKDEKEKREIINEILVCLHEYTLDKKEIDIKTREKILNILKEINSNKTQSVEILKYLGKIYFNLKEYLKSKKFFIKVLSLKLAFGKEREILYSDVLICVIKHIEIKKQISLHETEIIKKLLSEIEEQEISSPDIFEMIAKINIVLKNYEYAEKYLAKTIEILCFQKKKKKICELYNGIFNYLEKYLEYLIINKKFFKSSNIKKFINSCNNKRYYKKIFNLSTILYRCQYYREAVHVLFMLKKMKSEDYVDKEIIDILIKKKKFITLEKYIDKILNLKLKNFVLNFLEIIKRRTILKSYPIEIEFNLTNKCNLKCIMCDSQTHCGSFIADNKQVDDLIEIMPYLKKLILRGGEVFFHNRLKEILQQCEKNNVFVEIITNGLLLNRENINTILNVGNGLLTFSIDSINKNKYEMIRKGGSFERLIKNINLFNEMKKQRNSKIEIGINMVVMSINYMEIEKIIEFAGRNHFSNMQILPLLNYEKYSLSISQKEALYKKKEIFYNLAKQYNIKFINKNFFNLDEKEKRNNINLIKNENKQEDKILNNYKNKQNIFDSFFCLKPFKSLLIDEKDMKPTCHCNVLHDDDKRFYTEGNSILYAWNNKSFQTYRKFMKNNEENRICSKHCLQNSSILL